MIEQSLMEAAVIKLMNDTISDADGTVPEMYQGHFTEFKNDNDGYRYLQTLGGLVSIVEAGKLNYSPNFGYTAEQIAIETRNLTKLALTNGWDLAAVVGHFVTPENNLLMGEDGYRAHRYYIEQNIVQQIRRAAEQRVQAQTKLARPVEILGVDGKPVGQDQKIIRPH